MECTGTAAEVSNTTVGASLLSVEDLHVHFVTSRGVIRAVEGVNWRVYPGEMVAVWELLRLQRQVRAAGVDEVQARQPVLLGDFLRPQVLLHRQRVLGAALHGGVVADEHALDP